MRKGPCPEEMVWIPHGYCIDRFEASLIDAEQRTALSPHYPPTRLAARLYADFSERAPSSRGRLGLLPLPAAPRLQLEGAVRPLATSRPDQVPAGYLNYPTAKAACANAGKRLCLESEWVLACQGQTRTQYPYGSEYMRGSCNVHRDSHPAHLLYGDMSKYHLDPRLNLTSDTEGPLLRKTGQTPTCQSRWGEDSLFDMVGNVDEWIDDPSGVFVGGFYARGTRAGCLARISSHRPEYLDYSLGTRCCWSPP